MKDFFIISIDYPDTSPVLFLFWMLCVIAFAIWIGIKEDE
jgi:hypothetical protein